ncbi:unnamed protein product, partial [Closterium sp. NIES-54]
MLNPKPPPSFSSPPHLPLPSPSPLSSPSTPSLPPSPIPHNHPHHLRLLPPPRAAGEGAGAVPHGAGGGGAGGVRGGAGGGARGAALGAHAHGPHGSPGTHGQSPRGTHEAVEAFEAAAAQQADNMKLQELLVGAALKSRGYVKMQQAAMRMHKKRPKDDRYLLWAVCSMDLQAFEKQNHTVCHLPPSVSSFHLPAPAAATSAPGATSAPPTPASAADVAKQRRQLLQLAEAMIQRKAQSEGGLKSAEALRLYVDLLRRQGKGEEVVRVLQGPMAALFTIKSDLLQIRGEVQQDLARFTDAAATFKELLGV